MGPLLAVAARKPDPMGQDRCRAQDCGKSLARASILSRLELTPADVNDATRHKNIDADQAGLHLCRAAG